VAGEARLGAPGGASATDTPDAHFGASRRSATSFSMPPPSALKAAVTTPEIFGGMEGGGRASAPAANGAGPDGAGASVRGTEPAAPSLGLCTLGMEAASPRAGGETTTGGKAAPSATLVDGSANAAAAAAAAAARRAAGAVGGILSVDVLPLEDPGSEAPPVLLAAASACLLRRIVARRFSTAAFFFSLADRARPFGAPDDLAAFLEPPSFSAISPAVSSPESSRKSR